MKNTAGKSVFVFVSVFYSVYRWKTLQGHLSLSLSFYLSLPLSWIFLSIWKIEQGHLSLSFSLSLSLYWSWLIWNISRSGKYATFDWLTSMCKSSGSSVQDQDWFFSWFSLWFNRQAHRDKLAYHQNISCKNWRKTSTQRKNLFNTYKFCPMD